MVADAFDSFVYREVARVECSVESKASCADVVKVDTANSADSVGEEFLADALAYAERFKDL